MFFKQKKKKQSKNRSQFDSSRGGGSPWDGWDKSPPFFVNTCVFYCLLLVNLFLYCGKNKKILCRKSFCPNQIFLNSTTPASRIEKVSYLNNIGTDLADCMSYCKYCTLCVLYLYREASFIFGKSGVFSRYKLSVHSV